MAKTQNKTVETNASVSSFVDTIKDADRRADLRAVIALMKKTTKAQPRMWGKTIVGFGNVHYKYASGREGDWFIAGVSPRTGNLTLYIMPGLHLHTANLKVLGKFTTGKSCLYVKRLDDVKLPILEKMLRQAVTDTRKLVKGKGAL